MIDSGNAKIAEAQAAKNGEYTLENVNAGTYTLKVGKKNHVFREYPVTLQDSAINQDMEIRLSGDINGDGRVNAKDKKIIYDHIMGMSLLTDYEFAVGDVNGDKIINAKDKKMIYDHIMGVSTLWR